MKDKNGQILKDRLKSHQSAPGYRDFTFEVISAKGRLSRIDLDIEEALRLAYNILDMHDLAWTNKQPLDAETNETIRPPWIVKYGNRDNFRRLYEE